MIDSAYDDANPLGVIAGASREVELIALPEGP